MSKTLTLREIFGFARDQAKEIFLQAGEVSPMWHAITDDGMHAIVSTPWGDNVEKEIALEYIRDEFRVNNVVRYAFICEAWSVKSKDKNLLDGPRPSEHPDRREILRISAEDQNGQSFSGHFYILRPEHGNATLSPFHEDDPHMVQVGRMTGILT